MSKKKNILLRIDEETYKKLRTLSFNLSLVEGKRVAMGEIPKRIVESGDNLLEKLKIRSSINKKGQMFDIFVWLTISIVALMFFAGFIYGFNLLASHVSSFGMVGNVNVSQIGADTFGVINTGMSALRWVALVIVIAMILSILITNFLVRAHPVFFIVYVLITVVAVLFSVYISNAYESIINSTNPLVDTLKSFSGMNYLILNLPIWTAIIGFLGAIFLFIGIVVDREQGGGIPI